MMRLGRTIATRAFKDTQVSEVVGLTTEAIGADPQEADVTIEPA